MRIYPVILCGGSGTRLWPASRPSRPKQFIPLVGPRSLFQDTVERLRGLSGDRPPLVVAGEAHAEAILRQLAEIGVEGAVIIEPEGRDSAPAIAAAAAWIRAVDPEGVALVVASDHHIPDGAAFRASVEAGAAAAAAGRIVTFGVQPTGPATAYGYLQPGEPLSVGEPVRTLVRFVEKPDAETARAYVEAGYLWNSGNFVFSAKTLLEELALHAPALLEAVLASAPAPAAGERVVRLGPSFRSAPKISIDYAVMEKTQRAAVLPVSFGWSDLGAWDAVLDATDRDAAGNTVTPGAVLLDSRDCLVRSDGPVVVGIGLSRIAVIAEPDSVLVCDLGQAQAVKTAVDRLKAAGSPVLDLPARARPESLPAMKAKLDRWLFGSALPLWWALGADHLGGGFVELLDGDGRDLRAPRRARVQARQVYSFAAAGALGWPGPWRAATAHGLDYFLARYRRPDGLFRTLVAADGAPADETAMLYDQAFSLLALASAARALPERAEVLRAIAAEVVEVLRRERRAARGFIEAAGETPYQANPHMHLLEAALAWEAIDPHPPWTDLADEAAELCLDRFTPGEGPVREFFDAAWAPAPGRLGRLIEPGHQFEWAWLLERWGAARGRTDARAAALRLFEFGEAGVDPVREVATNTLLDDLSPVDARARLWPQTERLKAALRLSGAAQAPTARLAAAAASAARGLWGYLETPLPGLWRDKMKADGGFEPEPAPASSLYHIVCAIAELSEHG